MKKKLLVLPAILVGMLLSGCGHNDEPSVGDVPSTPDSSDPVSSDVGDSTNSDQSDIPVYETSLRTGARTRKYDERFDTMIDDFTAETVKGQVGGDATFTKKSYLQVAVDSTNSVTFPGNPENAAIYKNALKDPLNYHSAFEGFNIRMRVAKGEIKLENLVVALRGADTLKLYDLDLVDALDVDGEALPELTSEYQDYIISPMQSIDDADAVYLNKDDTPSETKVLDTIIGFHLYAKGDVQGVLEIEKVSGYSGAQETVIDDFNREDPNANLELTWWNGSTGHIITRSVTTTKNGTYQVTTTDDISEYEDVAVSLKANTDDIKLQTVLNGGTLGSEVAWSNLKDDNNEPVVAPVSGAYGNYVINLANSGITDENITGYKLTVNGTSSINRMFATSMEEPQAVLEFPVLDTAHASRFDDFSRTQSGFNGDYEASAANPIVTGAGLYYALSYSHGEFVTVANGHLTFDATTLGQDDYIQFKEASQFARGNHKYMVIAAKLEDGATYDNFRIVVDGGAASYANQWVAAQGLPTLSDTNPYTKDGYTWLVVDLELSGLGGMADVIDMYYSGTGKLLIDEIFFCSEPGLVGVDFEGEAPKIMDSFSPDQPHQWLSAGKNNGSKKIEVRYLGDDALDLTSFRIEGGANNSLIAANAGLKMYVNGEPIDSTYVASSTEETVLIIDLEESGWTDFYSDVTLVLGDYAPGYMNISSVKMFVEEDTMDWQDFTLASNPVVLAPTEGAPHAYTYVGWDQGASKLKFTLHGDGEADLTSFRLEVTPAAGDMMALHANGTLKMYDEQGNLINYEDKLPTTDITITIDLIESGWSGEAANINAVYGDFANKGHVLTITAAQFGLETRTIENILNGLPDRIVE